MFRGRFFMFLLVIMLLFGLVSAAGMSLFRSGWSQGYVAGRIADRGGEAVTGDEASQPSTRG